MPSGTTLVFAGSEQAVESAAWKTLFENNVPEGSSGFYDMRDEDAAGAPVGHLRLLWCGKLI